MATKKKTYEDGVKDALQIMNHHYFGKKPGEVELSRKNMRAVMIKADKKGTAVPAFWNFFKGMKAEVGSLINKTEEDFINEVKPK